MSGVRFKAEVRERDAAGRWTEGARHRSEDIAVLVDRYPSPAWDVAKGRIAALAGGDHTRIQLDEYTAIILERAAASVLADG